jgi:hypothetical protein
MIRGPRVMILDPNARQAPFAEYDTRTHRWRIWLTFDPTVTGGTYLDLQAGGLCERVTLGSDGSMQDTHRLTGPVE